MLIELHVAEGEEKDILKNLIQFYDYDFSEFTDEDVLEKGNYSEYPFIDLYWEESSRVPYLIRVEGSLAGFVLVRTVEEANYIYYSIAEFFVMKKYRRSGIGKQVAETVFNKHRGQWEVYQLERNRPAQTFWVKVISEYTNGNYSERNEQGKRIQSFSSSEKSSI
ncbi:MAG: GNAT family N-acetyltransferase [Paenibacillaceae bacterium]